LSGLAVLIALSELSTARRQELENAEAAGRAIGATSVAAASGYLIFVVNTVFPYSIQQAQETELPLWQPGLVPNIPPPANPWTYGGVFFFWQ
jgi:hypothetical protein